MARLNSTCALLIIAVCTLGIVQSAQAAPRDVRNDDTGSRSNLVHQLTNRNELAGTTLHSVPDWSLVTSQAVTNTSPLTPSVPVTNAQELTAPITLPAITEPTTETTSLDDADSETENTVPEPAEPEPDDSSINAQLDEIDTTPLEGTIVANRTSASITFFIEGELYRLAPLRSFGMELPRSTGVLNLYNCEADTPQTTEGCFWDPYLIQSEGFYEIFNTAAEGQPLHLVVEEAGAPPTDQIWIQNRTGQTEVIIYNDTTFELAPSAVQEFDVGEVPVATFYRRSCLTMSGETVCEWSPQSVEPGFYYALDENTSAGAPPNSQINRVDLQPVLAPEGEVLSAASAQETDSQETGSQETIAASAAAGSQTLCQLQIPVLNVRSGPGLEYLVVTQLTADGLDGGNVAVVGRDASQQWLAVDESVAAEGWVAAGPQFLQCDGDIAALPVAEITDGRLQPTPEAQPAAEASETDTEAATGAVDGEAAEGDATESDETAEGTEEPEVEVPKGQAVLVVTNAFDQGIRFTLAPDEYDLQPGETIYVVINPGRVQFSVSSPWRGGISGNAEFLIEPDQSATLYLYFVPDPSNSEQWELRYE